MPGALPPTSDYTYAIDLFIHQGVLKENGIDVKFFNQAGEESDVLFWEENFLGFPVGSRVPTGFFDDVRDTWVAIEDGFFVEVTDIVNGKAVLNLGGRDATALGITDEELTMVGSFAVIGQSYMRVPFPHFSIWTVTTGPVLIHAAALQTNHLRRAMVIAIRRSLGRSSIASFVR